MTVEYHMMYWSNKEKIQIKMTYRLRHNEQQFFEINELMMKR